MNGKKAKMLRRLARTMTSDNPWTDKETVQVRARMFGGGMGYNEITVNKPNSGKGVYRKMKTDYNDIRQRGVDNE